MRRRMHPRSMADAPIGLTAFVTGDTSRASRRDRPRSRPRCSAKQCHCGANGRSHRAHMTVFWHCKRHSDGVAVRLHGAKAGATRTCLISAHVPVMKQVVSHVTGYDPVTRFRDFETISAGFRAFRGSTPSRGWASRGGGEVARPLCLLAKTNRARCRGATGLVWARDESR